MFFMQEPNKEPGGFSSSKEIPIGLDDLLKPGNSCWNHHSSKKCLVFFWMLARTILGCSKDYW
jgi:hypothetical protein